MSGGLGWFPIDFGQVQGAFRAGDERFFARQRPAELLAARRMGTALVETIARERPTAPFVLGGFSQGAMLAADVALLGPRAPRCLVLFSPAIVAEHEWRSARRPGLEVFLSHGDKDRILPVSESRRLAQLLEAAGARVELHVFDGGHTMPAAIVEAAGAFLRRCR